MHARRFLEACQGFNRTFDYAKRGYRVLMHNTKHVGAQSEKGFVMRCGTAEEHLTDMAKIVHQKGEHESHMSDVRKG